MSDNFFSASVAEKKQVIQTAAKELAKPEQIIEKDLWLCWALEQIFKLPVQMTFKGGTSLAKLGLIQRKDSHPITIK